MKADKPQHLQAELPLSTHQAKVLERYGGEEFDARMKSFPDGYHNLGYWKDGCDRMAASRNLIELVVSQLHIGPNDSVLEAGTGVGRGVLDIHGHSPCKHLVGIDLTPENIAHAHTLASTQCCHNVEFLCMSATDLQFPDASFDKIFSVDSAVHFDNREQFFREAWRVLKPGGVLAIADTCINPKALNWLYRWPTQLLLTLWCVPADNVYNLQSYRARLEQQGFVDVQAESIGINTLAPVCDYFMSDHHWQLAVATDGYKEAVLSHTVFAAMKFAYAQGLIDYGLIRASKPLDSQP